MASVENAASSEMAILRRVVDSDNAEMSPEAARAILRLRFGPKDRARMNRLSAKNRDGKLKPNEESELENYIRVGQTLGILQSKARRSLRTTKTSAQDPR
jgi:hypothetical protein